MVDLHEAIRARRETTSVDFKERLGWQSGRPAQVETLRDLAALANRGGGIIVVGVKELADQSLDFAGLQPGDDMPDPTEVGQLFRQFFDPAVEINAGTDEVDGTRFGFLTAAGFTVSPVIATRDYQAPGAQRAALSEGDLLIRSAALATEKVKARDLRELLDRAVRARGRAFAAQMPPPPAAPQDDRSWGPAEAGARLLELSPIPAPDRLRLRDVEDAVQDARVAGHGMTYMPPEIDFQATTHIVREPGRVIAQARERTGDDEMVTTAEVTDRLVVRVREAPWEPRGSDEKPTVDISGLILFVWSAVIFAHRLYRDRAVEAIKLRIGLAEPAGIRLSVNRPFTPVSERYVATSRTDIWVERDLSHKSTHPRAARQPHWESLKTCSIFLAGG